MLRKYPFSLSIIITQQDKTTWKAIAKTKFNFDADKCPCCKTGTMIRIQSFDAKAPPLKLTAQHKKQAVIKNTIAWR